MKKLTIALALILCLVLCLFAFASCGKKKGGTATEAATQKATEHVHTPAADYTVDVAATCGVAGSESKHCTVCGEIIASTVREIPATGNHTLGEWVETTAPTVIADGVKTKTCSVCGYKVNEAVTKTEATIQTWTAETTGKYSNSKTFAEIQGDKHFYPTEDNPDGNDLLVEYSLLWNDTLLNLEPGTNGATSPRVTTSITDANGANNNDLTWWSLTNDVNDSWCQFAGGFEAGNLQRVAPDGAAYTPIGMCASGGDYDAYPNIGGADQDNPEYGWHRFGLRFHQEVVNEAVVKAGGTAVYEFAITLYFDGVPVSKLVGKTTGDQKVPEEANYLFTAAYDETDGIKYSDNPELDRTVYAILVNTMVAKADTVAYWADADYFYTCGKDFVQKVAPANDPQDTATIELADGVTKSAKAWYKLVDGSATHDHAYNVEVKVTKAATLLADGTKVMKCAYCDATQEVDYEYYPEVYKWDKNARNRYSPEQTTLGEVRGDKHFYEEGNDLLIEYSFLWNETTTNLRGGDKQCYLDTRLTVADGGKGKNITYWSPSSNINMSDCKYAGSFEYGGIAQNMPDNPYPGFNSGVNDGDLYPNIGGENNGDGTTQVNNLYGWHRVSIRYRNEVTNKDALIADTTAGATAATYNLELWVYIDGKLVIHAYGTDLIYTENGKPDEDRKLFSATSDGQGGIVYTENDDLVMHPVCLNSKRAIDNKTVYYSVADISMTVGTDFAQKVVRIDDPTAAQLTVAANKTVTATMWYKIACDEHVWDGNFTETKAATILNDGEKVEHCSVCGAANKVVVPYELSVYNSKSPSGYAYADGDYFFISKSVADIKGDKTFHPTATDADGNDLWFEYSFLWNDTLSNWDQSRSEMMIAGFRNAENKYRDFYYLYTKDGQSGDCPYKGHIDYSTYMGGYADADAYQCAYDLTSEGNTFFGDPVGQYYAGWAYCHPGGVTRASSPYVYDAESMTTGGWHRLGVRFHQAAEVDNDKGGVVYTGYTELYIDGVKVWKVETDMQGYWNGSQWKELKGYGSDSTKKADLKWNDLLLWYAKTELAPEDNADEWTLVNGLYYKDNDTMRVQARLDNVAKSTEAVYVAVDDVIWTCGDGFVRNVEQVVTPAAATITLDDKGTADTADDVTASGAIFFQFAD